MSDLRAHGEYCARQATNSRLIANQLEHLAAHRSDRAVGDELARAARLRREADLWDQLAGEISDYFTHATQEEPQLWP